MKKFILSNLLFMALSLGLVKAQQTYTFNATGSVQSYTVPSNCSIITVTVAGASGGNGGYGAVYTQTLSVSAGQVLNVYVGGAGSVGANAAGGYNGGGQAGSNYGNEGSGGGASDIRVSPYALANRIIVAGGGGGVGGYAGGGGGAGGLVGVAGYAGQGGAGGGGTSTSGGAGGLGNGCGNGGSGTLAVGGNGGQCSYGGGGGGGGYYGGGGGGADNNGCCADGGGAGGGSSYSSVSGGTCTTGTWYGAGRVLIKAITGVSIIQTSFIICNGQQNAALSATVSGGSAPYTYSWSTGATTSTIGGLGAGSYTCWIVSSSLVTYSDIFVITEPTAFTSYINYQYNASCNGSSDGYAEVGVYGGAWPYTYTWSPSGGNSYYSYGLTAGVYTCYISDGNGCTVARTATITQPAAPNIIAGASSTSVCAGGTVTLIGGGAYYYNWNNNVYDGVPFTPTASSNYIVTGTDYNGCNGYAQVSVMVVPVPTIIATSSLMICSGSPTSLNAIGGNTYLWSNGAATASTVVSPTTSTQYVVAGTNSLGCTSTASVIVGTYALPSLYTVASATSICSGGSITLTETGANSFTWQPGITNGVAFNPTVTTVYTVSATDGYGCISNKTSTIVVHPLPNLSISGSTAICQGVATVLSAIGANSYLWNTNAITSSISVSPQTTTTYYVTGTNANGCSISASFSLVVGTTPGVFASTTSTLVCYGSATTLFANGATSYTWAPLSSNSNSISITPSVTTTYSLSGTNNGCTNASILTLSVIPVPTLVLSGPSSAICALTTTTLSANGANSYSWSNGVTSQSISVSANSTHYFSVVGTGSNGCSKTDSIKVNITPLPFITINSADSSICEGGSGSLTVSGPSSFTWSTSDSSPIITVSPSVSTTYSVSTIGSSGCSNTAYFLVTVSPCTKIFELTKAEMLLSVYPNPNNGSFYVVSPENLKLKMVNSIGQIVKTFSVSENLKHTIEAKELPGGIYFIVSESHGTNIHQKIIITR